MPGGSKTRLYTVHKCSFFQELEITSFDHHRYELESNGSQYYPTSLGLFPGPIWVFTWDFLLQSFNFFSYSKSLGASRMNPRQCGNQFTFQGKTEMRKEIQWAKHSSFQFCYLILLRTFSSLWLIYNYMNQSE